MRIRKHDLGNDRWHLTVNPRDWVEAKAFREWMSMNMPECMCAYRFNDGANPYYEVRGRDRQQLVLLMLIWSA